MQRWMRIRDDHVKGLKESPISPIHSKCWIGGSHYHWKFCSFLLDFDVFMFIHYFSHNHKSHLNPKLPTTIKLLLFNCFVLVYRQRLVLTFYQKQCTWRIEQWVILSVCYFLQHSRIKNYDQRHNPLVSP